MSVSVRSSVASDFDKVWPSPADALEVLHSGDTVLIGGFGEAGIPLSLVAAILATDATGLTLVANNAGAASGGIADLLLAGRVAKMVCSFPRGDAFTKVYERGDVKLELVPQGTLAERIRAGGAGIGPFYSPVGVGTPLGEGKELREVDGHSFGLEHPIRGDVALIKAQRADRVGNLTYRATARNFNPIMATAARTTVVEVGELLPAGSYLDPEHVVTPGIFVDRVVALGGEVDG